MYFFCYGGIQFFNECSTYSLMKNLRWKSKSPMKIFDYQFQLKTHLFNVLDPNMGNLNLHIWKYLKFQKINRTKNLPLFNWQKYKVMHKHHEFGSIQYPLPVLHTHYEFMPFFNGPNLGTTVGPHNLKFNRKFLSNVQIQHITKYHSQQTNRICQQPRFVTSWWQYSQTNIKWCGN